MNILIIKVKDILVTRVPRIGPINPKTLVNIIDNVRFEIVERIRFFLAN